METITMKVQKQFCAECSQAIRRFIGGMDGVESIDVDEEHISIAFDASKISGERVKALSKDSVEKLGYRVDEEQGLEQDRQA